MSKRKTKRQRRDISYGAKLLSSMLSLFVLSSMSLAQNDSGHTELFTLKSCAGIPDRPPLNEMKVAGEFMTGTLLGMAAGFGAAYIGASITYDGTWFSDMPGAIVGFTLAYPLGCALGIYIVGNLGNDSGSFGSALGAAYGGLLVGAVGAWALSHGSQISATLTLLAIPPLLATVAFNKTRRYKNPQAASVSLLNFSDGKIDLGFPVVSAFPSAPGSSKLDWLVNLATIEF